MAYLIVALFVGQALLWRAAYRLWMRGPKVDAATLAALMQLVDQLSKQNRELVQVVYSLEVERSALRDLLSQREA